MTLTPASRAGIYEYAGLVTEVSEAGMRLLAEIVQDRLNGPRVLHDAWAGGQISVRDLRAVIPDTWLYVDWPERVIGAGKWVQLFRAAGFLSLTYGLSRPAPRDQGRAVSRPAIALKVPRNLPRILPVAEEQAVLDACTRLRDRFFFAVLHEKRLPGRRGTRPAS